MDTPTPVTTLSNNELQTMSATNITAALVQPSQFFNSQTAENFGGAANGFFHSSGGGSLNLHGVGTNRTLTLLDEPRMPPATIFGGPDAVSGVVNVTSCLEPRADGKRARHAPSGRSRRLRAHFRTPSRNSSGLAKSRSKKIAVGNFAGN